MPTYEYLCSACNEHFEIVQKITEDAIKTCPACGKDEAKRQISRTAFHLKGSGWYKTDYAASGSQVSDSKTETVSEKSSTKDSSSDKTSKASETKSSKEPTSKESKSSETKPASTSSGGAGKVSAKKSKSDKSS